MFEGATLSDGTKIRVEQAEWDDISAISYADSGLFRICIALSQTDRGGGFL